MILLLGGTGYIGTAFAQELATRKVEHRIVSRRNVEYTRFSVFLKTLRSLKPVLVINCAGFVGRPNVDECERRQAETLLGNAILPELLQNACETVDVPFAHLSSGCIFSGAKVETVSGREVVRDLSAPAFRTQVESARETIYGFAETDEPNFSFRRPPCSFYSGSKALGEEVLRDGAQTYIWRMRIPFDEVDNPRNYLTKIQTYSKVYDNYNSITHRRDFARACLDLWDRRAAFGIYNVVNPGFVSTREIVSMIRSVLRTGKEFEFWPNDEEFYKVAKAPRSNCILDTSKLLAAGVYLRPVREAVQQSLENWKTA